MKLICWNCHELDTSRVVNDLKELIFKNKLNILFHMETLVHGTHMEKIKIIMVLIPVSWWIDWVVGRS